MTFAEMQTYVRDRLSIHSSDTTKTTQIKAAINRARDRLVADFRLLVTQADITLTADTNSVTLPANVMEILSISTDAYALEPVTYNELADYRLRGLLQNMTGPLVYLREGVSTNVEVWPTPTETSTVTAGLVYVPQPTELSADGDTPSEIPRAFHDLPCEMAIIRLAESEEAPDLANGARRIVYGTPGTSERGLMHEFEAFMHRTTGSGSTRIWPKGF